MATKPKQGMLLHGIASAEVWDSTAEKTIIEGMNILDIHEGKCLANWEHQSSKDGGMGQEFVGKVIFGKKLLSADDCENATQKRVWNKYKVPMLYVVIRLFDGAGHPGAISLAAMARDAAANGDPAVLGLSVEGTTVEREGGLLKKTIIRAIAATVKPASKVCYPEILFDPHAPDGFEKVPNEKETNDVLKEVLDNLNKNEDPTETNALKKMQLLIKAAVVQKMMQKIDPLLVFKKLSPQYLSNGLAPLDFKWTDPDLAFLQKTKSAPITVNFSPAQLYKIARNGQHRNMFQHEAGTTEHDERKDFEHRVLGVPLTTWGKNRPIYGALHIDHMDPAPQASGVGGAPLYGTAYWILKPEVKERCSLTHADSFTVQPQDVLLHKDIDKVTAKHLQSRATDPDPIVEVQIHGGIDLATDIQGLVIHSEDPNILKIAQKVGSTYNIPVTSYDSDFNRTVLNTPIAGLSKTITAGGGNVAPSQLTGGAALAREVWPQKKKIKDLMWKAFCDTGAPMEKAEFAKFLKANIPEVSDGYLDYYDEAAHNVSVSSKTLHKATSQQLLRKIEYISIETKQLVKTWQDKMPGGLADNLQPEDFDQKELATGAQDELSEHTDDPDLATEMSMDHLGKDPNYYKKMALVEKQGSKHIPGQAIVQGRLYYITDETTDAYLAHPYDNAQGITRLPKSDAGTTYKLLRPLRLADPQLTLKAGEHGVAHLNKSPLQHSMIDGLKLDRTSQSDSLGGSTWAQGPSGKVFIKNGSTLRPNAAQEEVAIYNMAQSVGMDAYFIPCAAYTCPETGAMSSVHAAMSDLEHPDMSENAYQRVLQTLGQNGELDKLAALDYILGSSVRNSTSLAFSPERLSLLDNAFGNCSIPPYAKDMDRAQGYEWLGSPMHPTAQTWLQGLDRDSFLTHLQFNGTTPDSQEKVMRRFDATRTNAAEPRRKVYG